MASTQDELREYLTQEVNKKLASILGQYKGRIFSMILDNEIMTFGGDAKKDKMVRASYRDGNKPGEFHIGYYHVVDSKPEFVDRPDLITIIVNTLMQTTIFNTRFEGDIDITRFEISVDSGFNVIYINSAVYLFAKMITVKGLGAIRLKRTNRELSAGEVFELKEKFKQHSIDMYIQICTSIVLRRLKNVNALKFFKLHNIFVPAVLSGNFVFNPFLEIPDIKERFMSSELYKMSNKTIKHFGKVSIRYLTHKEICLGLHLDKFTLMPWKMFTSILAGNFSMRYPNVTTPAYLLSNLAEADNGYSIILSEDGYNRLEDFQKELYNKRDTLYVLSLQYAASVGTRDPQALYNIIKNNYI